jgi:hypothetical protein
MKILLIILSLYKDCFIKLVKFHLQPKKYPDNTLIDNEKLSLDVPNIP